MRFSWRLGTFLASSGWIQPRSIIRAAIQSVRMNMSRLVVVHDPSWLRTLAKNSELSLTSSVYFTVMPVCFSKTSRVLVGPSARGSM